MVPTPFSLAPHSAGKRSCPGRYTLCQLQQTQPALLPPNSPHKQMSPSQAGDLTAYDSSGTSPNTDTWGSGIHSLKCKISDPLSCQWPLHPIWPHLPLCIIAHTQTIFSLLHFLTHPRPITQHPAFVLPSSFPFAPGSPFREPWVYLPVFTFSCQRTCSLPVLTTPNSRPRILTFHRLIDFEQEEMLETMWSHSLKRNWSGETGTGVDRLMLTGLIYIQKGLPWWLSQ